VRNLIFIAVTHPITAMRRFHNVRYFGAIRPQS
jgi:hypothetical protein